LVEHGLKYTDDSKGMAIDLKALNEDQPVPTDLRIECVEDTAALRKWARAAILGFELPETNVEPWFELFAGLGFDLPLRNYLGTVDGEPVATSELFLAEGVAGIYVVATVPEARRQGIGAAMTLAPLRDARAMGFRIGVLHSSLMGLGVYRRLGFREYCMMSCHGMW
jgi:ribosomal protein S18 acetylase RimI-like enzyme